MTCSLCLCFLQDFIEFQPTSSNLSCEKLQRLSRTIACELHKLLTTIHGHHNMVLRVKREYLNLVEKKIHTPIKPLELHLYDVSLNYYKYVACNLSKQKELEQTIELICTELLSEGLFKCAKQGDLYEAPKRWLLDKYFFFLEHLKSIHDEHTGKKSAEFDTLVFKKNERISEEEIESWGNLYD